MRGIRRGAMLAAMGVFAAASAAAAAQDQIEYPPGAVVQPLDTGPGAELRRNLTTLASNPNSVPALTGAGRAALDMGDAEAALNFYSRADQLSPGDGATKAGMAAALVRLERGRDALTLFARAVSLGVPESEIAADRGLAYDTLGETRRAQADYALALRRRDDPEVRRRLALSLAISGEREAALRTIDGQLRSRDRAGWRTQAFVLALTGDAAGAADTAERVMTPADAEAMAPFLARLAALSPAQKALAVHFGHFPSDGRPAYAAATPPADPGALALARGVPQAAPPPRPRFEIPEPVNATRRIPGDERGASFATRPPPRTEIAAAEPRSQTTPPVEGPTGGVAPGFILGPRGEQPQPARRQEPAPAPARPSFESVADAVAGLPDEGQAEPAAPPPVRTVARPGSAAPAPVRRIPTVNPSRHWVQIAHASSLAALPRQYREARERAPALFSGRNAFAVDAGGTNRLLLGPFATESAARAFIAQLDARSVAAIAWTSPAGQEIERLQIPDEPRATSSRPEPEVRTAARGSSRSGRSDSDERSAARGRSDAGERTGTRGRSGSAERAPAHSAHDRTEAGQRTASRHGSDASERPPARSARGKSEPEPRTAASRRRSH